ncbi:MAG: SGNH/GDSL hydrolase family protein [Bacillota bacterium]|nr:SGNH/GDSL hydrolase family protein [Bacillota bacterium]
MDFEIYGDSIRAGYGLKEAVYLSSLTAFKLKNFAYNGATVFDIWADVYKDIEKKKAYALVGVGVNDLIYSRDPDRIFQRLMDIVKRLKDLDRIVIVESLLPVKKKYFLSLYNFSEEEINEKIKRVNYLLQLSAKDYGYYYFAYDFSQEELSTRDGLHPDEKGNQLLKIQFEKLLKANKIS